MSTSETRNTGLVDASRYRAMAAAGLFEGRRVELVRGEIIDMGRQNPPHATGVRLADAALRRVFDPGRFVISVQLPLALGRLSEPEPDVAVVEGGPRDFAVDHPTTAALVVEVSDSTLGFDTEQKAALYAEAGIPEYWVVDLTARRLEIRREPEITTGGSCRYRAVSRHGPGDRITPRAATTPIPVDELLP